MVQLEARFVSEPGNDDSDGDSDDEEDEGKDLLKVC